MPHWKNIKRENLDTKYEQLKNFKNQRQQLETPKKQNLMNEYLKEIMLKAKNNW